jgi:hypothetical protein
MRPKTEFKVYAQLPTNSNNSPATAPVLKHYTEPGLQRELATECYVKSRCAVARRILLIVGVELLSSSMAAANGRNKKGNIKVVAGARFCIRAPLISLTLRCGSGTRSVVRFAATKVRVSARC